MAGNLCSLLADKFSNTRKCQSLTQVNGIEGIYTRLRPAKEYRD